MKLHPFKLIILALVLLSLDAKSQQISPDLVGTNI